jgi:hypothetical protein
MIAAAVRQVEPAATPHDSERRRWVSIGTHSHMLREHRTDFDAAKRNLVEWAASRGIGAVGVGSPWEPVSARHYKQCETVDRDAYFGGRIAPETMMDREPIEALIRDLNAMAEGRTLFYLDNETPKNRHGHLWYVGFEYQVPAWHDYSQDRRVQFWDGDPCEDPNALTGGCHIRRSYAEVIALQRRAGALAVWAHPTSWWRHHGAFVTNIAAQMVTHLHADGYLDGMVVQGYDACHRAYQALWFDLLDRGASVPGFAELDACFDGLPIAPKGCFLNHVPCGDGHVRLPELIGQFRAARHFVSSGPHLVLTLDGQPTGTRVASGAGCTHRVRLTAWPAPGEAALSRVELLGKGGRLLASVERFAGGTIAFDVAGDADGGYVLGRAFGEHDSPAETCQQRIRHCALTNPVWLDTPRSPRLAAVETALSIVVAAGSPAHGAVFRVKDAGGELLEDGTLRGGRTDLRVPGGARLELRQSDGFCRDIPLAMANPRVREHIEYLADGHFLRDSPHRVPGDVSVEAFRFAAVRDALTAMSLRL